MKRVIIPIVIALLIILGCVIYLMQDFSINSGTADVLYNDTVYERYDQISFNLNFFETNAEYIGDFMETYAYGQEFPWEVYTLNSDANVLLSAHAVWLKPGYVLPGEFGEDFATVEYVVSEGVDFFKMEDEYKETATLLTTFEGSVKLEDILASEPSEITEVTQHDDIRFTYKNHSDMFLSYTLCSYDGHYYLNVLQGEEGTDALFEIKPEYVDLLTSKLAKPQ